jgi:hypothetical protein
MSVTVSNRAIVDHAVHELRNIFCVVFNSLDLLEATCPNAAKIIARMLTSTERFEKIVVSLGEIE